jgi:GTP-binding protein
LDSETVGNVSLQVITSDRPDAWEVRGRGELQLAVLVEEMRREGFELTVSRPEVLEREIDGVRNEPFERLVCDVPEDRVGAVTQLLGPRKGRLESMDPSGSGRVRLEYVVPARGLLGFRSDFLTETRGEGLYHHTFEGWMPWAGGLDARRSGALVADRTGQATTFAILNLQARGSFFIAPGDEVYEGMIVGEHPRPDDMDVNVTKAKKVNNIRAAAAEELERITPPRKFSLEQALEYLRPDECLEVTPAEVRMRKQVLDGTIRAREAKRAKQDSPAGVASS